MTIEKQQVFMTIVEDLFEEAIDVQRLCDRVLELEQENKALKIKREVYWGEMDELEKENEKLKEKVQKQKRELERWQNEFGDQDDFTNRTCGYVKCQKDFELDDPHYYDSDEGECYCNEYCFKAQEDYEGTEN